MTDDQQLGDEPSTTDLNRAAEIGTGPDDARGTAWMRRQYDGWEELQDSYERWLGRIMP